MKKLLTVCVLACMGIRAHAEDQADVYKRYIPAVARIAVSKPRMAMNDSFVPMENACALTGWYMGNGLVATAGHCLKESIDRKSPDYWVNFEQDGVAAKRFSLHFGLAARSDLKYRDLSRGLITYPMDPVKRGPFDLPVNVYGWVTLPNNFQVEEIVTAKFNKQYGDYAFLRIAKPWPAVALEIGNDADVKAGDSVLTIGNPDGNFIGFTKGVVLEGEGSLLDYQMEGRAGYSGAPIIHEKTGKVIAIYSHSNSGAKLGYGQKLSYTPARDLLALYAADNNCSLAISNLLRAQPNH